ncbi:helix-turn-helix transcriptional regulator [Pararhizobium mangrovi]|uniref:Helix-turn-helix transcriptional regulator n=1 Tax=Pararhizobium mangrovi TaxID=2590452 RepID=A0A506TVT1_9HYPH|nr:LuxR family transcriptional regulator [Pararhizobium mangrovi]TPW26183.1 helix-turn-helix transcriptional regulator [Pararhizobium mangrovi]
MPLDTHPVLAGISDPARTEIPRIAAPIERPGMTDVIALLNAMRRMVDADAFAVYTCPQAGARVGGCLSLVLDERPEDAGPAVDPASAEGMQLLDHVQTATMPLVWNAGPIATERPVSLLASAQMPGCAFPGIALPVRLGALGNGVVVFEGCRVTAFSDLVFRLHRMAYRVMTGLLRLEIAEGSPARQLSERELQCLQMTGEGCKSETIAERLGLSVHTVNAYLSAATAKLDAVNRIQAIAKAIRLGLIA